ncbi:MAG TPA: DEDD exonuclease domain-containing protein [Acidimicrobiia bacterium]|nr:DEDD exonuclease domain-containing protein [Acidimicrobiia bacterium]
MPLDRLGQLNQLSFEDLGVPLYDVTFCVVDLETTGGSAADCAITEIGAVKYRGGELLGEFATLVDPGTGIPPFITVLTGITTAMVSAAPPIEAALPAFLEFCGDAVVVGHNIRFDLSFLRASALRLGYSSPGSTSVDTVGLARRLIRPEVRDLTLATLAAHFRSPHSPNHRALADARATAHVFHALLERAGSLGVTGLDDLLALPTARGASYYSKISLTDPLPRKPGVYLFIDRDGQVIYIGKAGNLRSRVRAYFYGDQRRRVGDMLRQLDRIEHRVCANSLEAEITEVRLIHAHRPRFNQRSRPPRRQLYLKLTSERFPRLSQAHKLSDDGLLWLGPFRSKSAADVVLEALWDATTLRRCRGGAGSRLAPCAAAQLGVASCPCAGTVDPEDYRRIVADVIAAADSRPMNLLEPLEARMRRLAAEQRFEEAAAVRDRHSALARALERRLAWQALSRAGRLELESLDGDRVLVENGILAAVWAGEQSPPLMNASPLPSPSPIPPSVAIAEEAHLLWKWMGSGQVVVRDCTNPLALPATPPRQLRAA